MPTRNELLEDLTDLSLDSPVLTSPRMRTTSMSLAEYYTANGLRFYVEYDKVFTSGEVVWLLYQMPPESSGYYVALQERDFKSLNGDAAITIYWDSTGFTPGTPLQAFNENRIFEANDGNMVTSVITAPSVPGTIREQDFVSGVGTGSGSSGGISSTLGSRIYSPDSFFIAKIENLHAQSNRIHVRYAWGEIPVENYNLP